MRTRTAGLGIVALMAAATAGCTGASAVDGIAPAETGEGSLPRVAGDPSDTSEATPAPDRATTVVPSPSRPSGSGGRGTLADDPYLPPRAVIPEAPAAPAAPPATTRPTTPTTPTPTPSEDGDATETTRPTLPTPQRPIPLLPPDVGGPDLPDWQLGAEQGTNDDDDAGQGTGVGPSTATPSTTVPETEPETKTESESGVSTPRDSGARN